MRTVVIWDSHVPAPGGEWTTVLWSGFAAADAPEVISMPRLVEEHALPLRTTYLAWVYQLGEAVIDGRRVIDHLEIRPGFSYWWMTLVAHKPNYYEARHITDVIKCLAFETFCLPSLAVSKIRLCSANPLLREVFATFCESKGLVFESRTPPQAAGHRPQPLEQPSIVKRIRQAFAAIRNGLTGAGKARTVLGESDHSTLCAVDVLVNLNPIAYEERRFVSHYWTRLPAVIKQCGIASTWVHLFYRHAEIPSVATARSILRGFNGSSSDGGVHALLEDGMTPATLVRALVLYCGLCLRAIRVRAIRNAFQPAGSGFEFWPLFRRNWRDSFFGATALRNCSRILLCERLLSSMPHQDTGLFIQENQPWEMAWLHAWRANGHGRIVGVPHTTVRFWDLRYFYDPRTYAASAPNRLPMPDVVAVNGPVARNAYEQGHYPAARLVDVEALRFLHLANPEPLQRQDHRAETTRVLICGDNIPGSNTKLMHTVEQAVRDLGDGFVFIFKPHKSVHFDPLKYAVAMEVRDGDLGALLRDCDIVLTGNLTSAAVDAYCSGMEVACLLDGEILNGSPLRDAPGVNWFATGSELARVLRHVAQRPATDRPLAVGSRSNSAYFWLDPALSRWRTLLAA